MHRLEQDILDYQPDAVAIEERPVPGKARWVLYLILAAIVALIVGSIIFRVDRIVVAEGELITLDPESERIVRENLADIAKNRTVLVVSHRLSMLKSADSIIVLDRGYVVGHGPHAQLLADCALYKKLWQQQMEL